MTTSDRAPRATASLLLLLAASCTKINYLTEQGWGQLRLLSNRQRTVDVLRRPDLPLEQREKLQLVLQARDYAAEEIGLVRTGAYTRYYDTGGRPVAYNLSAAPKDALRPKTWTFPIVGTVPYLGFFEKAEAEALQRRLQAEGLDTYLRPITAYSSLGWFSDPVFSTLLDGPDWRLIEVVIHETTHTTIFLRGKVSFNESLAVFVGQQGTLNMLAHLHGPHSAEVRAAQQAFRRRRQLAALITVLYKRLAALYAEPVSRAEKIHGRERHFRWAKQRYAELFPESAESSAFVRQPLNNAIVLSYGRYLQGLRFHLAVYRCHDRSLPKLVALYRQAQYFESPAVYAARRCAEAQRLLEGLQP